MKLSPVLRPRAAEHVLVRCQVFFISEVRFVRIRRCVFVVKSMLRNAIHCYVLIRKCVDYVKVAAVIRGIRF
jgi:hypothetical protein